MRLLKYFIILIGLIGSVDANAQNDINSFRNYQFSFDRVNKAWNTYYKQWEALFKEKGVEFPNAHIYLRSFKAQNELEIWARKNDTSKYELIKAYNVCALSGTLGPKRKEGDKQVPEGYYFVEDFNPKSDFYLSMLVSYPNYSDLIHADKLKPGGDIYIHGECYTIGCLPMTNAIIQELYVLCLSAKLNGQNYIPIHILPIRFNRKGLDYLGRNYQLDEAKQKFWINLKDGYDYFEKYREILPVIYDEKGSYVF
jgi:murein L,D-transpeptidase YafK